MLRIHFTAADFARVRFAPRPAPLIELNTAFMKATSTDDPLLYTRWRQRLLRSLPPTVLPLRALAPAGKAPAFLDTYNDSLTDALESIRATHPTAIRSELQRIYASAPHPPPPWIRALHQNHPDSWHLFDQAQQAAFETVLRPVWPLIQDLHRDEFTRHALTTAEHGTAHALTRLVPNSRLRNNTWEVPSPKDQHITLTGQGVLLHPTFHWTSHPLAAHHPDPPLHLTYPAGPHLPLQPTTKAPHDPLTAALGPTRTQLLRLLTTPHTTTALARSLNVSAPTISAHTTALRAAGLLTTTRAGRSVIHERTALGTLLAHRGTSI
ncbi:ArsR family transcriptional regulator [Streptomyces rimosus]|uniref:ArsR/SmtB family transcription factor n=1 Tax=Streptomyces rimosus TaxID=1927 RepID=UPI0031D5591F